MSDNQRLYAAANANVLENGATEVRCKLVRTVLAKLAKSEGRKTEAENQLEAHQSGMEDNWAGKNDPETRE